MTSATAVASVVMSTVVIAALRQAVLASSDVYASKVTGRPIRGGSAVRCRSSCVLATTIQRIGPISQSTSSSVAAPVASRRRRRGTPRRRVADLASALVVVDPPGSDRDDGIRIRLTSTSPPATSAVTTATVTASAAP